MKNLFVKFAEWRAARSYAKRNERRVAKIKAGKITTGKIEASAITTASLMGLTPGVSIKQYAAVTEAELDLLRVARACCQHWGDTQFEHEYNNLFHALDVMHQEDYKK